MSRKRDKPYLSRHVPYSFPKRRRPLPLPQPDSAAKDDDWGENPFGKPLTTVIVIGISPECSVLDLKSRFEIYGGISRTRMDPGGVAYITFRSKDSADSAIAASLDPSFGITLNSQKVMWANDPIPQWREGVGQKDSASSSKLLKAEVPLSRHGRGKRLGSAIVNPRVNDHSSSSSDSRVDVPFKGREIVAYDDIL